MEADKIKGKNMINERILINLGIISIIAGSPHNASRKAIDGTFFQDVRLSLESKLLSLVVRNFDRLNLWRYCNLFSSKGWDMTPGNWRTELESQHIASKSFEKHIRPLYMHTDGVYLIHPNTSEQMYLYYNLSPQMVIELSREVITSRIWFLGIYEIFCSESLGVLPEELRHKHKEGV